MSPRPRRSSAASHHVEWLQLVDISGPFLSLSVLTEVFPQGLDGVDPEVAERLRTAYSEWTANRELRHPDVALHTAFIRFVLTELLEYPAEFIADTQELGEQFVAPLPEHGVTLRPDLAIRRPGELPKLLLSTYPAEVSLQKPYDDRGFHASPAERMRLLLRQTGVRSGLVASGGEWLLVHVPADRTATFTNWYTNLLVEERITLRALRSLLGARRLFGVDDPETLDGLFERSRDDEREVTDQLGLQTRRAVELLVSAFDRADRDTGGKLLEYVPEYRLYEAALAVVMRIIFLLAAEARGLFPDDGPWADSYEITPLRAQLEELADRGTLEALDRRYDAWPRLLATFRAVHDGVEHGRVRMPGYGGGLFDPDRYPFLEGVDTIIPRVSNRAVLHILDALQTLEVDVPGGRERRPLSFRALGVEQIGHVYEGLLDHTAIRADSPAVGLTGTAKKEPEIPLAELEEQQTKSDDALLDFLVEQTGRSRSALKKGLEAVADPVRVAHLREACDHDDGLVDRVLPFLGLVRDDVFALPMVFRTGAIYVTESPGRRATGTHYTPPSLTEPIVQYALEPVVYRGPAEGSPREEWELKRPSELLELKIADIAMGSAAFLVAACRYLATRLVESWERFPDEIPADAGADLEERELTARRLVAERCLYGVDVNPLAVEIAKVSMWLTTLRRDRPFTFLDHALRCGDSLLGLTSLSQLEALTLRPDEASSVLLEPAREPIRQLLDEVRRVRERVESSDAVDLREAEAKAAALAGAERNLHALIVVGDLVIGAALEEAAGTSKASTVIEAAVEKIREALTAPDADLRDALLSHVEARAGDALMAGRAPGAPDPPRPFHWVLEFPEVFSDQSAGFDAFVGNPPFLGGKRISTELGTTYESALKWDTPLVRGAADLSAHFVRRAFRLLKAEGVAGLIATDRISHGDTRAFGLDPVIQGNGTIIQATPHSEWPGEAANYIAQFHFARGKWSGRVELDGRRVHAIGSALREMSETSPVAPRQLQSLPVYASLGVGVYGEGFVLASPHALGKLSAVELGRIRPYLIAADLARQPRQQASRFVIDLSNVETYEELDEYPVLKRHLEATVRPIRESLTGQIHESRFWRFWDARPQLERALAELSSAICVPRLSKVLPFALVTSDQVFADSLVVFAAEDVETLGFLQSSIHARWVEEFMSLRGDRAAYVVSSCLRTLVFPTASEKLSDAAGEFETTRQAVLAELNAGFTATYNEFHSPGSMGDGIKSLRGKQVGLDYAVAGAYGWDDLELDHGFHETRQGVRFTIGPSARAEVLSRLVELNHARYAEEVAKGLHQGKPRARPPRQSGAGASGRLFDT